MSPSTSTGSLDHHSSQIHADAAPSYGSTRGKSNGPGYIPTKGTIAFHAHLRCTMEGPDSSYSSFFTHISSNVDSEDRMEPPIQTEYFLSGGAITLTLAESAAIFVISWRTLWGSPLYIVVPPEITMLESRLFLISMSDFKTARYVNKSMPSCSSPSSCGLNKHSGARNLSAPMVITAPSGNS